MLDAYQELIPIGVVGELCIGGVGLAKGYLNDHDLTTEKFINNPFSITDQNRIYRTGDLVRYLEDGNLEYIGRVDDQVKLRGFRIELGEIEAQCCQYGAVHDAVVVLDPGRATDKGDTSRDSDRLVVYVVAKGETEVELEGLRTHLQSGLPEYMVPSVFMMLEALPLTSNGKVDRKALPQPDEGHLNHAEYEAPVGETEIILAGIWQSLLGVELIGRQDNFFTLGAHSLLAVRLISLVQQNLDRQLGLKTLFENPVLELLAQALDTSQFVIQTPMLAADRTKPLPLSWAQQRLWFIAQLEGGSAAYHIPESVRFSGELCVTVLESALNTLVSRHETLRTTFQESNGEVWQVIAPEDEAVFSLEHIDVSDLSDDDQTERVNLESQAEHQAPFDLSTGPLIRGRLLRLSEDDHVLLVTMHHIVSDAWSMGIVTAEINTPVSYTHLTLPTICSV